MKRQKVLITIPDNYLTALDNKIDNILIRTRGDAVTALLTELQKYNPGVLKFEKPPETIPLPRWLNKDTLEYIKSILNIPDDTSPESALIVLDSVKINLKLVQKRRNEVIPPV